MQRTGPDSRLLSRLRRHWEELFWPGLARLGLWRGKGLLLLADDDEGFRPLLARLLTRSGYAVLEAADGREAVRLLDRHGPRLAAVVADLKMPGVDGAELILHARAAFPDLPCLLITGNPEELERRRWQWKPAIPSLVKPFGVGELLARLAVRPPSATIS